MFPEVTKALASEGIVGAPWPSASWSPSVILKLSWPNAEAQLGNLLPSSLVQEQPTVSFNSEPGVIYTIVFVDPDAPARETPQYGLLNHWLASGFKGDGKGGVEQTEKARVAYAPPSSRKTSHRSVFFLYKNTKGPLKEEQATIRGEAIPDRIFFELEAFASENELELIGMNFFISHNPEVLVQKS